MKPILSCLAALALFSCTDPVYAANSLPGIEPMLASTVEIISKEGGIGSGVVIGPGMILTAKHVVSTDHKADDTSKADDADDFIVKFFNGTLVEGKNVAVNPLSDLAIINVEVPASVPIASLECKKQALGEDVTVIGHPLGLPFIVSKGFVNGQLYKGLIPLSAIVNHGNSGGPVFDDNGHVLGILTELYNTVDGAGPGLMVPSYSFCAQLVIPKV